MPTKGTQGTATKKRSPRAAQKAGGIGSAAVAKATGKSWDEWFALLERASAPKMEHQEIATLLYEKHDLSGWWAQMVTVGYEQERLGRRKHEKPGGFEVSVSKTINTPLGKLYQAWSDMRARKRWLPESNFEVREATPHKSMRITWVDGKTHVDANFYAKGDDKSQVAVQHRKLESPASAEEAKRLWADRLAALKDLLER